MMPVQPAVASNLNAEFQSIGVEIPPDTRDATGDGVISPEDQALFLSWYNANPRDIRADFDRNGTVNPPAPPALATSWQTRADTTKSNAIVKIRKPPANTGESALFVG